MKGRSMKKELSSFKGKVMDRPHNRNADAVDTSDAPEIVGWGKVRRGTLYRPIKQQVTLRLDADVIDWFKEQAEGSETGYQTAMNAVLRAYALREVGTSGIRPFPSMIDPKWLPENVAVAPDSLGRPGKVPAWSTIEEAVEALRTSGAPALVAEATAYNERVQARMKGGPCVCGCDECDETPAGERSRFASGHDAKFLKRLRGLWKVFA